MTRDDRTPSDARLRSLATRGSDLLRPLQPDHASDLWQRVEAELDAVESAPTTVTADAAGRARDAAPATRAQPRWLPLALAAALALVAGVGIGTLLPATGTDEPPATLATIELTPLADDVSPHTATLLGTADGRIVDVDLADLPVTDGFHEVWLLDPATGALVSLGPVRADGTYAVPDTIDIVDLPVLDISTEPRDGDPTHSGDSVLRGEVIWLG